MKFQHQATSVLERTSHYMKVGLLKEKPAWYDVVCAHPPHIDVTRRAKMLETGLQKPDPSREIYSKNLAHPSSIFKTRNTSADRAQKNNAAFKIPKLEFLEDELRNVFYHQHPWELSRPKTLVENSGDDNRDCDWSRMLQLSKPLDGELVVQRTLWHLTSSALTSAPLELSEAYDKARFEFYQLRMRDEMNSAVLREESAMYGAVQPATHAERGIAVEQKFIDEWALEALEKTKIDEAGLNRPSAAATIDAVPRSEGAMWETEFEIGGGDISGKAA